MNLSLISGVAFIASFIISTPLGRAILGKDSLFDASIAGASFNVTSASDTASTSSSIQNAQLPIYYHGGRILAGNTKVYNIYYGDSWSSSQMNMLNSFATGMSTSQYFKVEKTYTSVGSVVFGGSHKVSSINFNTVITDSTLPQIVSYAIYNAGWSIRNDAIYFINTSPEIQEITGFCTAYCGFHTTANINGVYQIPIVFVGNPSSSRTCMKNCAPYNQKVSPNGDPGIDAMANIYAREMMKTLTDADGTGWFDNLAVENADKCAWNFGKVFTKNGYYYNEIVGQRYWLLQRNWNAKLQVCQG